MQRPFVLGGGLLCKELLAAARRRYQHVKYCYAAEGDAANRGGARHVARRLPHLRVRRWDAAPLSNVSAASQQSAAGEAPHHRMPRQDAASEHVCVACSAPEQHQQCTHSAHLCRITGCAGQCRCGLPPPCGVQTAAPARLCTRRGACVRLCGCECMAFEGRRRLCMGNGRMAGMQYCQYIIN